MESYWSYSTGWMQLNGIVHQSLMLLIVSAIGWICVVDYKSISVVDCFCNWYCVSINVWIINCFTIIFHTLKIPDNMTLPFDVKNERSFSPCVMVLCFPSFFWIIWDFLCMKNRDFSLSTRQEKLEKHILIAIKFLI